MKEGEAELVLSPDQCEAVKLRACQLALKEGQRLGIAAHRILYDMAMQDSELMAAMRKDFLSTCDYVMQQYVSKHDRPTLNEPTPGRGRKPVVAEAVPNPLPTATEPPRVENPLQGRPPARPIRYWKDFALPITGRPRLCVATDAQLAKAEKWYRSMGKAYTARADLVSLTRAAKKDGKELNETLVRSFAVKLGLASKETIPALLPMG